MTRPLVVANCSGFYGDRFTAMREVLDGGPVDVVTGDYLAELTMLILGRQQAKDPTAGYAKTFLRQLTECLDGVLTRGIKVVSNAGGLSTVALGEAVRALGARVATVTGDDLRAQWSSLTLLEGDPTTPLTANAYLGAFGIASALSKGADVVVTGRVTDASVVVGPAIWHHGWTPEDLDQLAGAVVAGHLLECGTQVTGGNFSLTQDFSGSPDFPLAEIAADGSCVITKHPGTGGLVTTQTVTEQLLYELTGAAYGGPDVTTFFDTVTLQQVGHDRVQVSGATGARPTGRLKVATNRIGGFRNSCTVVLTGIDIEAKAAWISEQLQPVVSRAARSSVTLARTDKPDAPTQEEASALLHVAVADSNPDVVGRAFSGACIELALASVAGFHVTAPPGNGTPYGVYTPAWVAASDVEQLVTHHDGTTEVIAPVPQLDLASAARSTPRSTQVRESSITFEMTPTYYNEDTPDDEKVAAVEATHRALLMAEGFDGEDLELRLIPLLVATRMGIEGLRDPGSVGTRQGSVRAAALQSQLMEQRGLVRPPVAVPDRSRWRPLRDVQARREVERAATRVPEGPTVRLPLGTVAGARSGDKGGAATLGVYAARPEIWPWLRDHLTSDRLSELLPETAGLELEREELPLIGAVLFQVHGILGEGVSSSFRFDPQGKALGEWLRSRVVDIPTQFAPEGAA